MNTLVSHQVRRTAPAVSFAAPAQRVARSFATMGTAIARSYRGFGAASAASRRQDFDATDMLLLTRG